MEDGKASIKRSKKAMHYGKARKTGDAKPGRSPKSARKKTTESTGKGAKGEKKSTMSPKTLKRKEKKNTTLEKIAER